jgi:hypothetical protein
MRCIAVASVVALNACGGGHSVSPMAQPIPGASSASTKRTIVNLMLTIPDRTTAAKHRLPAYVSTSTQSAEVIVNPGNTESDASLAAGATNCSTVPGGRACSIPVSAPIGADTFAVSLYDGGCVGGPPCHHQGNALSAASAFAATVVEGQANVTLPLVLGGVVNTVGLAIAPDPGPVAPAQHDLAITVTAKDAQGNTIIGPAPFVDGNGNPLPLQFAAQLSQTISLTDPILLHNGASVGAATAIAGPTDTLALRVDAGGQAVLGTEMRVTSGSTTTPGSLYYQAPGPTSGSLPGSTSYSFALIGAISTLAPAAFGQTLANGIYAGSNAGWISNISAAPGSDWTGASVNTYCHLNTASFTEGVGVDTAGNVYVSFFDTVHSLIAEVPRGFANAVLPCSLTGGPLIFGASGNSGGAVAVSPSTIFFVNHQTTGLPLVDEEVDVETPGLTSSNQLIIQPPNALTSRGLAGAAIDPTDGSLWVAGHFSDEVLHIVGTPGVPSSYAVVTGNGAGYALGGCMPDGIVSDGIFLYVSCSAAAKTKVITPNGSNPPTIATLNTVTASGSVANWNDIAIGPDGYLWILNSSSSIEKFNRTTGTLLVSIPGGANLADLVIGGDGDLWLANGLIGSNVYRFAQGVGP